MSWQKEVVHWGRESEDDDGGAVQVKLCGRDDFGDRV